jgi:hypothetical protein
MFKLYSDIYFVVYKLYYVSQNDNLETRAWPINWDGGSTQVKLSHSLSQLFLLSCCMPNFALNNKMATWTEGAPGT